MSGLADRVGQEDAVKFSATEAMCQEMGCWSFALVHEPDPVEMANVRWLSGYRHPRNRVGKTSRIDSWTSSATRGCS